MMNDKHLNDTELHNVLKSLPRERASVGFTGRVLRRLERPTRRSMPRWAPVAAAAILLLTLGFGWREWRHRQTAADLAALLAEKQALQAELEDLRRLTADARPVVYLGSDDRVDLVLDLARFSRHGGFGSKTPTVGTSLAESRPEPRPADLRQRPGARVLRAVY